MTSPKPVHRLLFADTERSPDMLYLTGFDAPDPFVACEVRGRSIGVLNALEYGRALKESRLDEVLSLEACQDKLRRKDRAAPAGPAEVIALIARERRVRVFTVPFDFPAGLADRLRELGLELQVCPGTLFPEREIKTRREAAHIGEGNRCAALGIAAAERMLRASRPRKGLLYLDGKPLTSERVKFAVEVACLEAGALSLNTIVAGGDQACDPHCRGSGPLRANELIIVDVFPRVQASGYHGDMTRTFLRGRASAAQHSLVEAVRAAQTLALGRVHAGVNGREVHRAVVAEFEALGYETLRGPAGSVGFFHGTGHGLGLAVHEMPRLSGAVDCELRAGAVVTVEPGLYYPGLGACRIEDVVQVRPGKPKLLSHYSYDWELR